MITLQYKIEKQDYIEFNKYHFIKHQLQKILIGQGIVIFFFLFMINREGLNIPSSVLTTIILLLGFAASNMYSIRNTRKVFKKKDYLEQEVALSNKGVRYRSEGTELSATWEQIKMLDESEYGIYLYLNNRAAIVIPKRSFGKIEEEEVFRLYAQEQMNIND